MKKTIVTLAATAVIASSYATTVDAASYKVQKGDSLWKIASKYDTSVSELRKINNLKSDLIFPNQVLQTSGSSSSTNKPNTSSSSSSSASTYTVKSGDTLSGIAAKHKISLSNLKKWNNISGYLIYPGDKLKVSAGGSSSSSSNNSSSSNSGSSSSSSSSSYKVKSGDSLWKIANNNGVSVANLKSWNNLSSDVIRVGQTLKINGKASSGSSSSSKPANNTQVDSAQTSKSVDKLISVAKSQLGKPYVWGGSSTAGFDCSGFIYYAFKNAGYDISRTSAEGYFNRSYYVSSPQPGDLIFFKGTYKAGISHMGIYLGGGQFIHADNDGVRITSTSNSYYAKHFDSYKRFY
ncbi:C40 family peptidase [Terribacillus saccharophilus]|uniref:Peptidoglycan endopeptidase n=1 Tax=Terribacillus saccharophilus TaxID=361277 RepID=A0ABX4GXR2_9BACI|nr:peptidoglycan endopeptidase [Terribacillus saccharophilus]PAD35265.1 peptidoglycan endopeptidase [Terribacillus saccharophilus]PAD99662.1 peptidoglycan endopeptidase [Terribacillus saccharophilus]